MSTPPARTPSAPSWPHCAHGADPATESVGCRGIHVPGHTACLAHLADPDRTAYLAGLAPGADIDHRGTPFTRHLLTALLDTLRDPTTGNPHLGDALFSGAQFSGAAWFRGARFFGRANFSGARFSRRAEFGEAQFSRDAWFGTNRFDADTGVFDGAQFFGRANFSGARFSRRAEFGEAQFSRDAWFGTNPWSVDTRDFDGAKFSGHAEFGGARFSGHAEFGEAQFSSSAGFGEAQFSDAGAGFGGTRFAGAVWFSSAHFAGEGYFGRAQFSSWTQFSHARFSGDGVFDWAQFSGDVHFGRTQFASHAKFSLARFEGAPSLGPMACAGAVVLSGAVFTAPVTLEIAAQKVICERTRWESTATLRLRYAIVDLNHAVLAAPVAVTAHPAPFTALGDRPMDESLLAGAAGVRVASVQGVDAAHLVLTDTDLADCLFSGAFHLDQLRLGKVAFASAPTGRHYRGIWPTRWSRRRTLAEEHHWRAQTAGQPVLLPGDTPQPGQWRPGPHHPDPALTPDPEDTAALYRHLRKAFEDGKNEPGAADFYYGECEMRRHDRTGTPTVERRLLWAYWLLSGYGLRASRAAGWLLAAMSLTVLLLVGFGLPTHDPDTATAGTLHGNKITLYTSTPAPALHGGWDQRMTWTRAEGATRVAVNSVIFRSSGQNLTTAGTYIEMASRLLEPTLLALAILAIRGRIKR
ncbi:pentapeptide repeat-containing protein [Streptomyces sp. NPDC001406]|uniref:pentapeptide repeat-containing protein n=1 Tax=Streptomyces sp. NPDC001406 TaxID=3364572 RepID=UPI00367D3DB7